MNYYYGEKMTVQINTKVTHKTLVTGNQNETVTSEEELQNLIDDLIVKVRVLEGLKKATKRAQIQLDEMAQPLIKQVDEELPPSEGFVFTGEDGARLVVTPRTKKVTDIDNDRLIEILGQETFNKLAKVSIGDIRKYLNPQQQEQVLLEEYAGRRRLKTE